MLQKSSESFNSTQTNEQPSKISISIESINENQAY